MSRALVALSRLAARLPAGLRERAVVVQGRRGLAVDRFVLRWTGVSLVTFQYAVARGHPYCPTLLLTTTGRRSGARRTVALPWVADGTDLLVCGSAGGGPRNPDWVANLRAEPACAVRLSGRTRPAVAHVAAGAERERVYAVLTAARPVVAAYERAAATHGRTMPLVVIRPSGHGLRG